MLDTLLTGTDGLTVNDPFLIPNIGGNLGIDTVFFIMSRNLALKIFYMALTGRKKSILEQCHFPPVFDNAPPVTR